MYGTYQVVKQYRKKSGPRGSQAYLGQPQRQLLSVHSATLGQHIIQDKDKLGLVDYAP